MESFDLEWLPHARNDLRRQLSYVEQRNASASLRLNQAVVQALLRLRSYPESGRPGRIPGTRELVVRRTRYVIIYRLQGRTLLILRLLHGAQRWP